MIAGKSVGVIIPALNEEASIGIVVDSLSRSFDRIIVVDNGSTDQTAAIAQGKGATVVRATFRGYGAACLRGMDAFRASPPDIILFIDADASDHPDDALQVATLVANGSCCFCIGSRVRGNHEAGSLTPLQQFGNWLSTTLIRLLWRVNYSDLGPLRAIKWEVLESFSMKDRTWGWTIEMQIKAAKQHVSLIEIPVRYRVRIGTSKISGTILGSIKAGVKIIATIIRYV